MKKALALWLGAVILVMSVMSCSLLPDVKRILGDYWLTTQHEQEIEYINGSLTTNYTDSTNYASKAASEEWITVAETSISVTTLSNGAVVTNESYTYSLDEAAGTITMTGDFYGAGSNTTMTFPYTLSGDTLTVTKTLGITMNAIFFISTMTNITTNVYTKE